MSLQITQQHSHMEPKKCVVLEVSHTKRYDNNDLLNNVVVSNIKEYFYEQ